MKNSKNSLIEPDYDDGLNFKSLSTHIKDDLFRNKNKIANNIVEIGENLLIEIDEKKNKNEIIKKKYINFILKQGKNSKKYGNDYSFNLLNSYSFEDVRDIYFNIKNRKKFFIKIIHFIFNV